MFSRKLILFSLKKKKNCFSLRRSLKTKPRIKSRTLNRLYSAPQRKGTITRLAIMTPKKPNSAIRHVAKIVIYKTNGMALCRIPGVGSLPTKFNRILCRGGRANDLPNLKKKRRSIYGAPRPENLITHRRRRYRHLHF